MQETIQPTLSIIVPVYNAAKFLARTLQSVQAQTVSDWELIAVDDGSKDCSADIAREFAAQDARIRLVQQTNGGVAAARNRGYAETHPGSSYIIFLDNDDLWASDMLEKLLQALAVHQDCAAAHGRAVLIDSQEQPYVTDELNPYFKVVEEFLSHRSMVQGNQIVDRAPSETTTFNHFAVRNCIVSPGCVLFRRSALPDAPLFDLQTVPSDDWDLYLNVSRFQPFAYIPEAVFYYRIHDSNASGNVQKMHASGKYVRQKALRTYANTPRLHDALVQGALAPYHEKRTERLQWMRDCLHEGKLIAALQQGLQTLKIAREMRSFRLQNKKTIT